jgi:hypothetical protein
MYTREAHTQHGKPQCVIRDDQPDAREGQAGCTGVAPPNERGGSRYVRPTATALHLGSTVKSGSCHEGEAAVVGLESGQW